MNVDDLEQRLQRQPIRSIPADWRKDVLRVAEERRSAHGPQAVEDGVSLWAGVRPLALALAASVVLLLSAHVVANLLADGRVATENPPVTVTECAGRDPRMVKLFAAGRPLTAMDADTLQRWRDRLKRESACTGNGG